MPAQRPIRTRTVVPATTIDELRLSLGRDVVVLTRQGALMSVNVNGQGPEPFSVHDAAELAAWCTDSDVIDRMQAAAQMRDAVTMARETAAMAPR